MATLSFDWPESARIEQTWRDGPLGMEQVTYRWDGPSPWLHVEPASPYIGAPRIAAVGQRVAIGPYRLYVCDFSPWRFAWLCCRDDALRPARVLAYRATRLLDLAYRRLVVTAAVWGLADYHPGTLPSWRDLHAFKRGVR